MKDPAEHPGPWRAAPADEKRTPIFDALGGVVADCETPELAARIVEAVNGRVTPPPSLLEEVLGPLDEGKLTDCAGLTSEHFASVTSDDHEDDPLPNPTPTPAGDDAAGLLGEVAKLAAVSSVEELRRMASDFEPSPPVAEREATESGIVLTIREIVRRAESAEISLLQAMGEVATAADAHVAERDNDLGEPHSVALRRAWSMLKDGSLSREEFDEEIRDIVDNLGAQPAPAPAGESIHYSHYASQPYVTIACTNAEHYVSGSSKEALPESVHRSDGGLYSFKTPPVTCEPCRERMKREGWLKKPGEFDGVSWEPRAKAAWQRFNRYKPKLTNEEFAFIIGHLRGAKEAYRELASEPADESAQPAPAARVEGEASDGELERIRRALVTDDNVCTAHAIYIVEKRVRDIGMDPNYTESICWYNAPSEEELLSGDARDGDQFNELESAYQQTGKIPMDWARTGYRERWEFVQPFLTRGAAEAYGASQAHNLGEWRVYVESGYRNPEWQWLRCHLANAGREFERKNGGKDG